MKIRLIPDVERGRSAGQGGLVSLTDDAALHPSARLADPPAFPPNLAVDRGAAPPAPSTNARKLPLPLKRVQAAGPRKPRDERQ